MSVLLGRQPRLDETRKPIPIEVLLASYFSAGIVLAFVVADEDMCHWFILPTLVCALLMGPDAVLWLKGEHDLVDPKGLVGIWGWYAFFLAPLLFIHWGVKVRDFENPPDWRPWVGYLSVLCAISLAVYQSFQHMGFRARVPKTQARWTIDVERVWPLFLFFGGVVMVAQAYFFYRVGGIAGVVNIRNVVMKTGRLADPGGFGLFEIAGNSLPVFLLIFLTLIRTKLNKKRSLFVTVVALIGILVALQFVLGGLTGSRSATVWSLFWIVGIVHYFWRPISTRSAVIGLTVLVGFMYIYGFYKSGGSEALAMLVKGASFGELEATSGRTFEGMLLGDLTRVDTQSYELYRLENAAGYDFRWGETYFDAFLRMIPRWINRARPIDPAKTIAGTELFYGKERYVPGDWFRNSSRVYGLAGEAILNFGVLFVPVPFAVWGFLMGRYRRSMLGWPPRDARRFLAPFVTLLLLLVPLSDLDNLVAISVSKAGFITLLVLLASRRSAERVVL